MSIQQADRIWRETMAQILQQVQAENTLNIKTLNKDQQGNIARSQYMFYLKMYKNLNEVYRCQVHPQKRLAVLKALTAVVGRLAESKMICAQHTQTFTPDMYNICADGTQLPEDLAIPIPAYAAESPNLFKRNELLMILIKQFDAFQYNGSLFDASNTITNYQKSSGIIKQQVVQEQQQEMTLEEAILLIQTAERGRNARLRYKLMRDIGKVKSDTGMHRDVIQNREAAAIRLQRQWRVVLRTRQTDAKRQSELVFLGLASKSGLENKGRSLIPLVQNLLSAEVLKHQRDVEMEYETSVKEAKTQLEKSLFSVIKGAQLEAMILPHQMQLALCPLSSPQDPTTNDSLESLFSLSRQIDKVHVMKSSDIMKRPSNIIDSGFPLAPELLRQRIIQVSAEFMQTQQFRSILQMNKIKALQVAYSDQLELDKDKLKSQVETEEAQELIEELRKRHYAAIRQWVDTTATIDAEEQKSDPKGAILYPKTPLQIETADEAALMKAVYDEEEAIRKARGKKKKAKPAKVIDDGTEFLSHYCVDLVESTVQYFNRWQRHADADFDGQPYDAEYVKEIFRNKVFRDCYVKVFAEVENYLYEMQVLNKVQAAMDKAKGKYKRPKPPKKKKDKKSKLGALGPEPELGPVGDQAQETAFAELVKEGIIKLPKPANMTDIIAGETFFTHAAKNTSTFVAAAAKDMGLDPEKDAFQSSDIEPLSLQAIKQNIISDIILPLSTPIAREFVARPMKLLLYGPPGSGKTLFVRAIATELGALFIDLSPANLINKFPGSQVSYLFKLLKLVVFQNTPCVIYIDEAEIVFGVEKKAKKKGKGKAKFDDGQIDGASMQAIGYPKESPPEFNPSRIKKEIVKLAKTIQQKDGIVVIGNATKTFNREKGLIDFFDRYLYLALPDYTQRLKLISKFFEQFGLPQYGITGVAKDVKLTLPDDRGADGLHGDNVDSALGLLGLDKGLQQQNKVQNKFFDLASLARMFEGFSAGNIEEIISEVLGGNRLCNINTRPLDLEEFSVFIKKRMPQYDSIHAHRVMQQLQSAKVPPPLVDPEVKKK